MPPASVQLWKCPDAVRDVISELPDDILYSIIKCLTLRDAVNTSVLSHRWKDVYLCLSTVQFDWGNMFPRSKNSMSCRECNEKFVRGVNQFIDSYRGSRIDSFSVSFCLGDHFTKDIDQWISFGCRMRAKTIKIHLYCQHDCAKPSGHDMYGERTKGKYVLCRKFSGSRNTSLKHLELKGCILGPKTADQFSCLETLKFICSHLAFCKMDGLVNLKDLSLVYSKLPAKLCLGSLVHLESLLLADCAGIEEVQLSNNVNLHSVIYGCTQDVKFDFSGAPNLERFYHGGKGRRDQLHYIFNHLQKYAPALRTFSINTTFDSVRRIPESIISFKQVTELNLMFCSDTELDFLKLISIFRGFPSLRNLNIVRLYSEESDQGNFVPDGGVDEHAKEGESGGVHGTSNQIEFDNYLLKRAIFAEQMFLKPGERIYVASRKSLQEGKCGKASFLSTMQQPSKLLKNDFSCQLRDVISKLPDEVMYLIIKHLALRDAAKASVLLHRWKGVYCYLKDLKFGWFNMFQDAGNSDFWEICESPCREYRDKFVRAVNQFLNFYHGTKVRKFRVSFCLCCDFSNDIDRWVSFAIRMGVEKMCIKFYCEKYCCKRRDEEFGGQSEEKYIFKSELFEGKLCFGSLALLKCLYIASYTWRDFVALQVKDNYTVLMLRNNFVKACHKANCFCRVLLTKLFVTLFTIWLCFSFVSATQRRSALLWVNYV
ncbi:unnamed protein product [Dovyalis caffra]|uniref:F-box domain-containing protein n=1 Tax=Dovyalis caffra TaxID=77055 RepID=A0AAV1SQC1_9ROSI|nr:unnamed protein product [Dovyalis caffra]